MTHIRYEHAVKPGGKKQIIGMHNKIVAVATDGTEVDFSELVSKSSIVLDPGEPARLQITIIGFEIIE